MLSGAKETGRRTRERHTSARCGIGSRTCRRSSSVPVRVAERVNLLALDEAAWQTRYVAALRRLRGDATRKALDRHVRADEARFWRWHGGTAATRALEALVAAGTVRFAAPGTDRGAAVMVVAQSPLRDRADE